MQDKIFYFIITIICICDIRRNETWLGLAETIISCFCILGLILYFNFG